MLVFWWFHQLVQGSIVQNEREKYFDKSNAQVEFCCVWFAPDYCGVGILEMRVTHSAMSTLSFSTSFIHGWA
jgi:hypothetical protein